MNLVRIIFLLLLSFSVIGCGGGGSDDTLTTPVKTNQTPVASAGDDIIVHINDAEQTELVKLNGTASDPDGDNVTFKWQQVSGPQVELLDAETLTPSFQTSGIANFAKIVWSLVVTDSKGKSHSDEIVITIIPAVSVSVSLQGFTPTSVQLFALHQADTSLIDGALQEGGSRYSFDVSSIDIDPDSYYLVKATDSSASTATFLHLVVRGGQLSNTLKLNALTDALYLSVKYSTPADDIDAYFDSVALIEDQNSSYAQLVNSAMSELSSRTQTFANQYSQQLLTNETETQRFNSLITFLQVELQPNHTQNWRQTEIFNPALARLPFGLDVEWTLNQQAKIFDGTETLLDVGTNTVSAQLIFSGNLLTSLTQNYHVIDEIIVAQKEVTYDQATTINTLGSDGELSSVYFPENALAENTMITALEQRVGFSEYVQGEIASKILKLEPSGLTFAHPVSVQIPYFGSPNPGNLMVVRVSEGGMVDRIAPTYVDLENQMVHFNTEHFTQFILDKDLFGQSSSEKVLNTLKELSDALCDNRHLEAADCNILNDLSNGEWEVLLNIKEESGDTLYDLFSAWYAGRQTYHSLLADQDSSEIQKYRAIGESFQSLFDDQEMIGSMGAKYLRMIESGISEYDSIGDMTAKAGLVFTFLKRKKAVDMLKLVGMFIGNPLPMDFASWYTTEVLGAANKAIKDLDNQLIGQQISRYYALRAENTENFDMDSFFESIKSSFKNGFEVDGYLVQYRGGLINDGSVGGYKKFPAETYEEVLNFWQKAEVYYQRLVQYKASVKDSDYYLPASQIYAELDTDASLIADKTLIEIFLDAYDWQYADELPSMSMSSLAIAGQPAALTSPYIKITRQQNELESVKNEMMVLNFHELANVDAKDVKVYVEKYLGYQRTQLSCVKNQPYLTCEGKLLQDLNWGINNLELEVTIGNSFSLDKAIRLDIQQDQSNTPPRVKLITRKNRNEYTEGESVTIDALVTDDGSIENISWDTNPENGADININANINDKTLSFTAPYVAKKTAVFVSITATDNEGAATSRVIRINLEPKTSGEFTGKFTTSWLSGKSFWRTYYHFDSNEIRVSEMKFNDTYFEFEQDQTSFRNNYQVTSTGKIKYGNNMYIGTSQFNQDSIKLCWGTTADNDCWGDYYQKQFEYLFYDRQKAESFAQQAENTRGVYEVWGGNSMPSTGIDWFNPSAHGYKLLGKGIGGRTQKFYGNYKHFVIVSRFGSSLYLDSILGSNGQYYGWTSTTSNIVDWDNIKEAPDGKTATFKYYESFYSFPSLDEEISFIKVYTTRYKQ